MGRAQGIQTESRSWSTDRDVFPTLAFLTLKSLRGSEERHWGPTHHRGAIGVQNFLLVPLPDHLGG